MLILKVIRIICIKIDNRLNSLKISIPWLFQLSMQILIVFHFRSKVESFQNNIICNLSKEIFS